MPEKVTLPEAKNVVGFPKNKKAVIICARGHIRVIERHYFWDKKKKRGSEKREYLGYIIDNAFYTNEDYRARFNRRGKKRLVAAKAVPVETRSAWEQIAPLEPKAASEIPLYNAIAEETGLKEDLTAVWGKDKATAAISIASHWLNTGSNAAYLYESWAQSRYVPYPEAITSKQMSELFRELKNTPNWRKDFFGARIKRLQDKEMFSFDATQIASQATEISYAQYGVGKEGGYQRQVGLILLVGHESHTPVLFRILPETSPM